MPTRFPLPARLAKLDADRGEPEPLLVRWRDVPRIVGKTRSAIYRDIRLGKFPKPVKTGAGDKATAVAFRLEDLRAWAAKLPPAEYGNGQQG